MGLAMIAKSNWKKFKIEANYIGNCGFKFIIIMSFNYER